MIRDADTAEVMIHGDLVALKSRVTVSKGSAGMGLTQGELRAVA